VAENAVFYNVFLPFWTTAWVQHDPETAPRGRKGRIIAHLWRTMAAKLALEILSMISFGYKRRCDSRKPRALHFGPFLAATLPEHVPARAPSSHLHDHQQP
jgi:hypothetical protein